MWMGGVSSYKGIVMPYTFIDQATNRLLDSNAQGNAYTLPGNGGPFQTWNVFSNDGFNFFLQDGATGLYLDGAGIPGFGNVYTKPFSGATTQQWQFLPVGNFYYVLSQTESGLVLDSNADGQIYTNPANGGPFQSWLFLTAVTAEGLKSVPKAPPVPASAL
jgi:hypothetical protein